MASNTKFNCLCGVTAKSSKGKNDDVWFRCGKAVDHKTERQKQLHLQDLGCNLRMNQQMIEELNIDGFQFKKHTPKCTYHNLYAKLLRVNNPEKPSYGKWFYVCNAQSPDAACSYFTWFEQEEEEEEIDQEEDEEEEEVAQPPPAKKIKATSNQKKNIEEEQPKPKKQCIESQSKKVLPKKKLFKPKQKKSQS